MSADLIYTAMTDDLLKRADCAIRENQITREQCLWNLMQARAAGVRIKRTLQWARAETSKVRQLGLKTADRVASYAAENPQRDAVSSSSKET